MTERLDRDALRRWLDRWPPVGRDLNGSYWRDFASEPCACSQGHVVVPAPDGSFGWVMARCERCNAAPESATLDGGDGT